MLYIEQGLPGDAIGALERAVETGPGHQKAAANLKRIEGRGDRAGLLPLDLPTVAREFLEEVIRR